MFVSLANQYNTIGENKIKMKTESVFIESYLIINFRYFRQLSKLFCPIKLETFRKI